MEWRAGNVSIKVEFNGKESFVKIKDQIGNEDLWLVLGSARHALIFSRLFQRFINSIHIFRKLEVKGEIAEICE